MTACNEEEFWKKLRNGEPLTEEDEAANRERERQKAIRMGAIFE